MSNLELGAEVKYLEGDKWKNGVIHSIKSMDVKGKEQVVAYLVDTGKDAHSDKITYDQRDAALTVQVNEAMPDTKMTTHERMLKSTKIADGIISAGKLPKSKIVTEVMRQPVLVEVTPDNIESK